MKKNLHIYIHTLLVGILITIFLVLPASADTGVINSSVVNIRSGPATTYEIAGSAYQGTEVSILESSNGWHKITLGPVTGWVSASLIDVKKQDIKLSVNSELANLRSGPGTSYDKTGQLVKGDTLILLDVQGEWYQVKTSDGKTAYIASFLVDSQSPVTAGNSSSPAATAAIPAISTNAAASAAVGAAVPAQTAGDEKTPVVYLDNLELQFDVPPIIENDRTLVPLRAIFEAMGATVEWDDATRTVTSRKGDTTVVLTIGSRTPTVNGIINNLDVPAKIAGDRTLAPLRFVGEAFDGTVGWDGTTRTITIVSPPTGDIPASAESQLAAGNSSKKAIAATVNEDLVNLRSGPSTSSEKIDQASRGETMSILAERDGWFQVSRGGRILWVSGQVVTVAWEENEPIIEPTTVPVTAPANGSTTTTTNPVDTTIAYDTEAVRIITSKDEAGLKIEIGSSSRLKTTKNENSSGIRYEFEDRHIEGNTYITEILGGQNLEIRGQNQGDNAIVEISIPKGIEYRASSEENGKKEVITIPNFIVGLQRETFGSGGERLILNTAWPATYTTNQTGTQMQLELTNILPGKAQPENTYNSSLLNRVRFTEKESGNSSCTLMTIETSSPAKFALGKGNDGNTLHILFINQNDVQLHNSMIILDPGHGGNDTGARGTVLNEKDVNLDIALQAGAILQARGMNIGYTRNNDSTVGLEERTTIANLYNAQLFVSIHNNSTTTSDKQGTETYYYAPLDTPELFMQSTERARLATCLQQELLSKLNRPDRGVKQANFSVLRNSQMPSALVEIAFISNPYEQQLLQQEYFKAQAAQAIADAITAYCSGGTGTTVTQYTDIKI